MKTTHYVDYKKKETAVTKTVCWGVMTALVELLMYRCSFVLYIYETKMKTYDKVEK